MKAIAVISFLSCAFSVASTSLTIGPDVLSIPSMCSPGAMEADTLRILPREGRLLEIGEYAFWNSSSLKVIEIPSDAPLKIEEGAFRDCPNLESVCLPDGSTLEGQYVFSGCNSLERVKLPSDLKILPPHSFSYCRSLSEVILPESLERIGNNAFSECRSLQHTEIPDNVTELESYAFSECKNMKSARLPANGALLGELVFSGCRSLETLEAPSLDVPRFDCNSSIFEPDERELYSRCILFVPIEKIQDYIHAPGWDKFRHIIPLPQR